MPQPQLNDVLTIHYDLHVNCVHKCSYILTGSESRLFCGLDLALTGRRAESNQEEGLGKPLIQNCILNP